MTLPSSFGSVSLARRTAQTLFLAWGKAPSSTLDTALLITTELVTNTVRHATGAPHLDLTLGLDLRQLTVAVHDQDPSLPPWPPTVATTPGGACGCWPIWLPNAAAGWTCARTSRERESPSGPSCHALPADLRAPAHPPPHPRPQPEPATAGEAPEGDPRP